MNQPISYQETQREKKRVERNRKIALFSILILTIVYALSYFSFSPAIRLRDVELVGGVLVEEPAVAQEVARVLSGTYLHLFPKDSAFLYRAHAVADDVKSHFPRIDTIEVSRTNLHTLRVTITERKPSALFCLGEPTGDGQCYFMDSSGIIFSEAPQFSGDAYTKYYNESIETPLATPYLASSTEFADLVYLVEHAKALSLRPAYLTASTTGEYTLGLVSGTRIFLSSHNGFRAAAQNLDALLRSPAFATMTPSNLLIDYIDLRYGDKIFYKIKSAQ